MRNDGVQPMSRKDIRVMFMNVCSCGQPWAACNTLYRLLMWLHVKADYPKAHRDVAAHVDRCDEYLQSIVSERGAQYILFYLLTALGLEEHGGSVPGWLTGRGEALLLGLGREAADNFEGLLGMCCAHGLDIEDECPECARAGLEVDPK